MRKLLVVTFAFFAGPALAPAARAMGTESPSTTLQRPANPDYEAGKKAIEAQDWKGAIAALNRAAAAEPGNANVQNELGYSYRKSGNVDMAFKYYNEALRLDPDHKGANEYIGETYLMVGNLPKAEEHLARLDKICTFGCQEYTALKNSIADYKRAHPQ